MTATEYGSDVMTLLLGNSYHPGGLALLRRLADLLVLEPGQQVLNVAAGRGATALLLAGEHGVTVDGVEPAAASVALASGTAEAAGLGGRVRFQVGEAARLPFGDGSFDAVVGECVLCAAPDHLAVAAELARVLRPGGRVGLTEVTVDPNGRRPRELSSLRASLAWVAEARSLDDYAGILAGAGLRVRYTQRQDEAIGRTLDQIDARLDLVRMTAKERAAALGLDLDRVPSVLAVARRAIADRVLGYGLLIGQKPDHSQDRRQQCSNR